MFFILLKECVIWNAVNPTAISVSGGEGKGFFTCSTRGMCEDHLPALAAEEDLLAMGD